MEDEMSYLGISIKDAINKINRKDNGWFLPAIQRPYVWGSRYENEAYICKLFDSIIKGYPIGGLIIWETDEEIAYREFVTDYEVNKPAQLVDEGLHGRKGKSLIYDGQQRLQTLYSCLEYTFNKKILVYDLLFDLKNSDEPEDVGFSFVDKHSDLMWNYIRMNNLFSKKPDEEKIHYRKSIVKRNNKITDKEEELIENNVDILWDIFVKTNKHSLAYFSINTSNENIVNEVFERLNTGGMALSLSDLLFTKIKSRYDRFEENLQKSSNTIYHTTNNGYLFNAYNILQVIHLLVKNRVRVDPKKVNNDEIDNFESTWNRLEDPLQSFFTDYIWGQFKIDRASIIPRKLAIYPIIIYFYNIFNKGYKFKDITSVNLHKINKYFIKSQINDWNLQSFIDNFTRIISEQSNISNGMFDYPIELLEDFIADKKKRNVKIEESRFIDYVWFSLKILTPNRSYQYNANIQGRLNPEIDHIFPKKLSGYDNNQDYIDAVDIIYNMQPIKGKINNTKSNIHPKLFFTDIANNSNGDIIQGSKYLIDYEFFPNDSSGQVNFNNNLWDNPFEFIAQRKKLMLKFFGII